MPRLLDDLRRDHAAMADVLCCLDRQTGRLEADAPVDFDVIRAALDYFEGFPAQCHHPKEDLVFARLVERDRLSAWIVGDLQAAHRQQAENLGAFATAIRAVMLEAELPRAQIAGWARNFIALQRRHMAMEQANFFPAAERSLSSADWHALEQIVPGGAESLHGSAAERRYDALRLTILAWDEEDIATETASPVC